LPANAKKLFAKTMRAVIDFQVSPRDPPKIWEISSLGAGVHVYWLAQSEPAMYASYRTSRKFKKWNALPWYGGFPVVNMWGYPMGWKKEVEGMLLESLMCFPVEDEHILKQKALNLAKFSIPAEALSLYAQNFMYLYPYVTDLEGVKTQRDMLEISWQKALQRFPEYEEVVGELSDMAFTAIKQLQELSGLIVSLEELPENIKSIAEKYKRLAEEEQKVVEKIPLTERLKALAKRPEVAVPPPVVPSERKEEM